MALHDVSRDQKKKMDRLRQRQPNHENTLSDAVNLIHCTPFQESKQVNRASQLTAATAQSLAKPIPPADTVALAVRALESIQTQLSGEGAMKALKAGNSCANVDPNLWSPAWEGARVFRDQWLMGLARNTRNEWRRDVADIMANQPAFNQESKIAESLEARLRITLDFAFTYLTPRHVCFLGDALMLAFDSSIPPAELSKEIANAAARSPKRSDRLLDALVLGVSGMYRYQPERVMASSTGGTNF
ncbi:hypothetical protein [Paucibacter soli]|uniref:hypothetical protein n=1 Tax=Paucibacter soli TaxID=3133433 RepID=UPI003097DADC